MIAPIALVALLLAAGDPAARQRDDPCRRPHCTLVEDLPLVIALASIDSRGPERLPVAPGVLLDGWNASYYLWDRHRHGHGESPERDSPVARGELGSVPCDPAALESLYCVAMSAPRSDKALGTYEIVDLLERNGRFDATERLLLAEIPPGTPPEEGTAWLRYAEFLVRRGRFAEALALVERGELQHPVCGIAMEHYDTHKFSAIKRCCTELYGQSCAESLDERRFEIVGLSGLAKYIAEQYVERGIEDVEYRVRMWFEQTILPRCERDNIDLIREMFARFLHDWNAERQAVASVGTFDWNDPADVARAVARVRELIGTDLRRATDLLRQAARTGLPIAGHAVFELVADVQIAWSDAERENLKYWWRDGVLTRTFGCADPDDPATW